MKDTTLAASADRILRTKHDGFSPHYDDEHGNTHMVWYDQDAERLANWFVALNTAGVTCDMRTFGAVLTAVANSLGDRLMDHAALNEMMRLVGKIEAVWRTQPEHTGDGDDAADGDAGD